MQQNEQQEDQLVLRRMLWTIANLVWFVVFLSANALVFQMVDIFIAQVIAFLLISLFTLVYWSKWNKKIKELL